MTTPPGMTIQPETLDPYPERFRWHPGEREHEATSSAHAWEFTNRLPVTRQVVQPATTPPTQVITVEPTRRHPDPFTAFNHERDHDWGRPPHPVPAWSTSSNTGGSGVEVRWLDARRVRAGTGPTAAPERRRCVGWALVLMCAAEVIVFTAAVATANYVVGLVAVAAMALCGLLLVAAESVSIVRNTRR